MNTLYKPLTFTHGPTMKNRFMLAPLTNTQSDENGELSDEEFRWLTMRAEGGFGLTMTCAAHIQAAGKGFPGQLGIFSDEHLPGLTRLAAAIKAHGSIAVVQLHHAGMRAPAELIGETPHCPSVNTKTGARALSAAEVEALIEDFIAAAERAERAGFDGVEIHGAHGYIIGQFLSAEINQREDAYGGSPERRARLLFDIISGVRSRCGDDFMLGVRLSPERFGMRMAEVIEVVRRLYADGDIDFLDMSLWDVFKKPEEEDFKDKNLMAWFTELPRGDVRLGVAGKIRTPQQAEEALALGVDWIMLGRAAILNHDFPNRYQSDPSFVPTPTPVSRRHLEAEGLSPSFQDYMSQWKGFVDAGDASETSLIKGNTQKEK